MLLTAEVARHFISSDPPPSLIRTSSGVKNLKKTHEQVSSLE